MAAGDSRSSPGRPPTGVFRWVDRVVGLEGLRADTAIMRTPDGNGRLELTTFHSPSNLGDNRHAPANTPGIRHVAFA
ncbi:MAG: hypothetical protein QOD55_2685, partial [Solirubrobacteraceae bacterium]|nr:hypothetical protein [Solirubrobacteraceae bacterium]